MDNMRINMSSFRQLRLKYSHTFLNVVSEAENVTPFSVQVKDLVRYRIGYI